MYNKGISKKKCTHSNLVNNCLTRQEWKLNKSLTHNKAIIPSDFGHRPSIEITQLIRTGSQTIDYNDVTYSYGSILVSLDLIKTHFENYGYGDVIAFFYIKQLYEYPAGSSTAVTTEYYAPVKLLLYPAWNSMNSNYVDSFKVLEFDPIQDKIVVLNTGVYYARSGSILFG